MNDTLTEYKDAIEQIKKAESCRPYLRKSKKGNYICPFCGSGTGPDKSGALAYDPAGNLCFCYASCKEPGQKAKQYDVIDLYMKENDKERGAAIRELADKHNIRLPESQKKAVKTARKTAAKENTMNETKAAESAIFDGQKGIEAAPAEKLTDYTAYFEACRARLGDPAALAYLAERGISRKTAERYGLGFDPEADPANRPGAQPGEPRPHPAPRIITPFGKYGYVGRRVDGREEYAKANAEGGKAGISGADLLEEETPPIIIVEGIFDALSIAEAEPTACALSLNSTSNISEFMAVLKEKQPQINGKPTPVIIALDNDKEGVKKSEELAEELEKAKIPHMKANLAGECKDANEALKKYGKEWLQEKAGKAILAAFDIPVPGTPADTMRKLFEKVQTEAYKPQETGLAFFDNLIDGGVIQQSLMLIMAAPSVGKTTLCQEVAEEMAERKRPVLYLSLEMPPEIMLAKALSYRLAKEGVRLSATQILQGYKWTDTEKERALRIMKEYQEGPGNYITYKRPERSGVDDIKALLKETGEAAKRQEKEAPAVIVDYLQLITGAGDNEARTVKETIQALKDYAASNNTFVICIVAINREAMKTGRITLESGRDSSAIEYTGDYVLSLQYWDLDQDIKDFRDLDDMAALQGETWRRLIIRVLKHRLGQPGRSAKVYFRAEYNYFVGEKQPLAMGWPKLEIQARGDFPKKEKESQTPPAKNQRKSKEQRDAKLAEVAAQKQREIDERTEPEKWEDDTNGTAPFLNGPTIA